ncbi:MAG: hypothetical protein KC503_23235, partial [Myxococcales bacterium]|nr:hypothetical protein [Myxococcales bacterium]
TRLSEGDLAEGGAYYGSTMLTVDLGGMGAASRESGDVRAAAGAAQLIESDRSMLRRLAEVARDEAKRIAGVPLERVATDVRVHAAQTTIHVDVDVEARARTAQVNTPPPSRRS